MKTITITVRDDDASSAMHAVMPYAIELHMVNVGQPEKNYPVILEPPPKGALKAFKEKSKKLGRTTDGAAQARAHILHDMADMSGFTAKDVRLMAHRYGIDEKQAVNSLHHLVGRGDVVKSGGNRETGYTYRIKVVDAAPLPNSPVAYP